ncbi:MULTISPECIES: radical SAM family heme chaperone HemW [unclassified Ruminococcus]|uniref:radical SAM family heme chaperone HemW n=1 Tax=unclassified Ruminococcus TaxID=2608920 RepID=UPI00210AA4A3|nr:MULTISPECIES: radical SAM family heme chaperone HemW [unclassified Ruminococcus]MCQ4022128.1 radical SAM family heme chaperone HemW [Ruminococcus sp. zg-924]MCQ4114448.1 radical SAM family heme chaperone HemW [Ruminococcus sp. zg-921]
MQDKLGLYIHIPFCGKKCPYCSFYSVAYSKSTVEEYCHNLINIIRHYGKLYDSKVVDTVYFGGGTPSLIGSEWLAKILDAVNNSFKNDLTEVTIEVNPTSGKFIDYNLLKIYGVNRISVGMQSSNENELKILGRKHSNSDIEKLLYKIRASGIDNISLDLMCCIPQQTIDSLAQSIDFCNAMDVKHISSYMLKIEEGTLFYKNVDKLSLPDEDTEREMYLFMCNKLMQYGYNQYEISNFSKQGYESRHNLKYWNCDDYLGIGPTAHSMVDCERFYFNNNFKEFYDNKTVFEANGGDEEEYAMLRLRLSEGLRDDLFVQRFDKPLPSDYFIRALKLQSAGLVKVDNNSIALTSSGFLLSNSVTAKILWG